MSFADPDHSHAAIFILTNSWVAVVIHEFAEKKIFKAAPYDDINFHF